MTRLVRILHRARDERGLSLAELMVTMFVLVIVLLISSNLFVSAATTTTSTRAINEGTRVASNAMNELHRVVRFAVHNPVSGVALPDPAVQYAGRDTLALYSLVGVDPAEPITTRPPRPSLVRFELDASGQLIENRWEPQASGRFWSFANPTHTLRRVLGGEFLATGLTEPLFRYYTASGSELVPPAGASLSPSQRREVTAVTVTMNTVPLDGIDTKPVIVTTTIELLNLKGG